MASRSRWRLRILGPAEVSARFMAGLLGVGELVDLLGEHAAEDAQQFLASGGWELFPARDRRQRRVVRARGGTGLDWRRDMVRILRLLVIGRGTSSPVRAAPTDRRLSSLL